MRKLLPSVGVTLGPVFLAGTVLEMRCKEGKPGQEGCILLLPCLYVMSYLRDGNLNTESMSHIYLRPSLKVTSCNILSGFLHEIRFSWTKVFTPGCTLVLKSFRVGSLSGLGFSMVDVQSTMALFI